MEQTEQILGQTITLVDQATYKIKEVDSNSYLASKPGKIIQGGYDFNNASEYVAFLPNPKFPDSWYLRLSDNTGNVANIPKQGFGLTSARYTLFRLDPVLDGYKLYFNQNLNIAWNEPYTGLVGTSPNQKTNVVFAFEKVKLA